MEGIVRAKVWVCENEVASTGQVLIIYTDVDEGVPAFRFHRLPKPSFLSTLFQRAQVSSVAGLTSYITSPAYSHIEWTVPGAPMCVYRIKEDETEVICEAGDDERVLVAS